MPYLRIADVKAIGRKAIADGEVGKCPKCGSPNLGGLIAPDFESRRCDDCGKVSDQWRIREGITAIGLDGQSDGGAGGPQGGSIAGEVTLDLTGGRPHLKRTKMGRLVPEADVVPFSGSGPITFTDPNASLPWQRRKRKIKERPVSAMPASYYALRNKALGLSEDVQLSEWMDDLLDDAHEYGYKAHKATKTKDGQTVHVFKHPKDGTTLHINDGPKEVDKHWMIRSKAGEILHQGSADHDPDWMLGDVDKDRVGHKRSPSMGPIKRPAFQYEDFDKIGAGDHVTIVNRQGQQQKGRAVMRGPAGWVLNLGGQHGTPGIAHAGNTVSVRKAKTARNADALMGGNRQAESDDQKGWTGFMGAANTPMSKALQKHGWGRDFRSRDFSNPSHVSHKIIAIDGKGWEHFDQRDQTIGKGKDTASLVAHLSQFHGKKESVNEEEGFLAGRATDSTQVGKIIIRVLDDVNISVLAPSRIIESVEVFKFFEQFQILLPKTPMLSIRVMEKLATWWRDLAETGDVMEIDCVTGFAKVTNQPLRRVYALGSLGSIPDTIIPQ